MRNQPGIEDTALDDGAALSYHPRILPRREPLRPRDEPVIPWTLLDTATLPGAAGRELRLKRRGAEFSIMLGTIELMNSRLSGSEEALATLVATRLAGRTKPRLLIGGLGMGFTLRAALASFPAEAEITVSELIPAVVEWARGPMAELFAGCLDDPRVTIAVQDVGRVIADGAGRYDAILLDVDNGPEALTVAANDRLYEDGGLGLAKAALRSGGILAVWSQGPDRRFTGRLRHAGFAVEEVMVRAHRGKSGARHIIWLARKA
ncbi:spermidine synthase [Bosea sp. OAE506]